MVGIEYHLIKYKHVCTWRGCFSILKNIWLEENTTLSNTISLALITKSDHPQKSDYYISICLIRRLYQIISKLLTTWYKRMLMNFQSSIFYIPNWHILDDVEVVNEIIDLAEWRKGKLFIFKYTLRRRVIVWI